MAQYMLLVYQEEVDAAEQAEREKVTPMLAELHASLREAGLLVDVARLIAFAASPNNITGAEYLIDGGIVKNV